MSNRIKLRYREENKVSRSSKYSVFTGCVCHYDRHSKTSINDDHNHKPVNSGKHGDDYAPIFRMVALDESKKRNFARPGESGYYSGLLVDDNGN